MGANNNLANDEWVMVTFTSTKSDDENSKTKTFKIYVNGELERTENKIGNRYDIDKNSPISIGSNSNGDWNHFKGALDDIRIYNKALTEEEVSNLYASQSVQDVNASIIIAKGSTTGSVEVKGIDDATDETDESIINSIISAVGASVSVNKTASLVITDDDVTSVSLSVDNQTIKEGTNQYATVTATLDKVSELPVTVYLDGSGVDEADYSISTSNDTTGTVATLVAHYKFNGDANDETDNDHNGTNNGATLVEDRFGNAQSAMYFDGVDDNIKVPYVDELRIEKEITVNSWIKVLPKESNTYMRYLSVPNDSWLNVSIHERDNNERYAWRVRSGGYWDETMVECPNNNCNSRPQFDQWYMMTYTLSKELLVDEVTGDTFEIYRGRAYMNGRSC